jgi:hypothetical protein
MRIGAKRYQVDWGHLLLLLFIAGVIVAYWLDARAVSLGVNNLLLVQPAAILGLILCVIVLPQCFVPETEIAPPTPAEAQAANAAATASRRQTVIELGKVAAMAAAFGLFAFNLETVGFDVASWLFVAVGLYICGERRWLTLLLFPTAFTLALIYFFRALIPFPLATLVL